MEEFFTRDNANKGIVVPLETPDGEESKHTMTILGVDSDQHYQTELDMQRKILQLRSKSQAMSPTKLEKLVDEMRRDCEVEIMAGLIGDWTFKQKCSHANKVKFLTNAPQFVEMINRVASDRKRFFTQGQNNSKATQK